MTAEGATAAPTRSASGRLLGAMLLAVAALGYGRYWSAPEPLAERLGSGPALWADESTCVDCHPGTATFHQTGHARTLTRADAEPSRALLQRLAAEARPGGTVTLHLDALPYRADAGETVVPVDWCFGSGRHAHTWVGLLPDSWGASDSVELRWTWFRDVDSFAATPGQGAAAAFAGVGVLFDHPKTHRCFACHTSQLPIRDGRIDQQRLVPGVTCQRCHGSMVEHVRSQGTRFDNTFVRDARQTDAVNRCAECHRRAEEREPADVRPDNPEIARFQPVGMVQSACYRQSPTMTCTTCHDVHRPMEAQDSQGDWQCLQCHAPAAADRRSIPCSAGHTENCVPCHMPKVRATSPMHFTDHWIRVRR